MRLDRISAIMLRQFYLLKGNLPRISQLLIWVLVDIVVWGFMTKYLKF